MADKKNTVSDLADLKEGRPPARRRSAPVAETAEAEAAPAASEGARCASRSSTSRAAPMPPAAARTRSPASG
jgi:hypothetical protein